VRVLDTVAAVYLATGQPAKAEDIAAGIVRMAAEGSAPWFRARVMQARIAQRRDRPEEARKILNKTLERSQNVPDEDMLTAALLMEELREKTAPPPSALSTNQPVAAGPDIPQAVDSP